MSLARCLPASIFIAASLLVGATNAQTTIRSSLSSTNVQGNGNSRAPNTSAVGRYTAFKSDASTLVPGDTNGVGDVFLRDHYTSTTTLVSKGLGGVPANGESFNPSISNDGRFVAFFSAASNLVAGDTNNRLDVFVYDQTLDTIELISKSSGGAQGNQDSDTAEISGTGRYVVFLSTATNLVAGDTNGKIDVFLCDRSTGTVSRVSVGPGGAQADENSSWPDVSDDGTIVTFQSSATTLVAGDTNGVADVFYRNIALATTTRINLGPGGVQANLGSGRCTLSSNGGVIAFYTDANNLVPGMPSGSILAFNRLTNQVTPVSVDSAGVPGNSSSAFPSIDHFGRYVAFESFATNLVNNDTNNVSDIFVRDLVAQTTVRVSVSTAGTQSNGASVAPSMSREGRYLGFRSAGTNLVPGDTNSEDDIFLRELGTCSTPVTYCVGKVNSLGCVPAIGFLGTPSASAGAGFIIKADNVRNNKPGLLLYTTNGPQAAPFQGGTLCVQSPIRRTVSATSGGNPSPANDCSGTYLIDMNAFALGYLGGSPALELQIIGQQIHAQWWGRDNGFPAPFNSTLSNALGYLVCD